MHWTKIDTKWNLADIMTKHVPAEVLWKHFGAMGFETRHGRAQEAVTLVEN